MSDDIVSKNGEVVGQWNGMVKVLKILRKYF